MMMALAPFDWQIVTSSLDVESYRQEIVEGGHSRRYWRFFLGAGLNNGKKSCAGLQWTGSKRR